VFREAIFFDGSLPVFKRDVRLERLERSRQELANFRAAHPALSISSVRKELSLIASWDAGQRRGSPVQGLLPHPPFLLPCVAEALLSDPDMPPTRTVPEEADIACARLAQSSGAAILTDDSDLSLYDLGSEGSVLWLRDLSVRQSDKVLQGRCFRPARTARGLHLSSFLYFGFERYLDPNASTAVIQQRAGAVIRQHEQKEAFDAFGASFEITAEAKNPLALTDLDSRVAEFITQAMESDQIPQVYLPILHEDPMRDSSWMYGSIYRQLAYSMFYHLRNKQYPECVVEYTRKSQHIGLTNIPILALPQLEGMASTVTPQFTHLQAANVASWYASARLAVLEQKIVAGKAVFSQAVVDAMFGVEEQGKTGSISWEEDVHLLGNAHAVLYSWRMLKQILCWALEYCDCNTLNERLVNSFRELGWLMGAMPPISILFLQVDEMRNFSKALPMGAAAEVKGVFTANIDILEESTEMRQESPRKRKKRKVSVEDQQVALGGNAFAALAYGTSDSDE
jgi:hypothetical protein